ncbi:hypothetical protein GR925_03020 [Streptomyces sp. HUCO-GS316]|nr:hypothetical protein [Streptomyces sp. HUCO-GS316]
METWDWYETCTGLWFAPTRCGVPRWGGTRHEPFCRRLSGSAHGAVDSVDISLATLFKGVYIRNLSLHGALISAPGRLMDGLGDW